MEVKNTDRNQLKEYFKKNKIPKETDFSELIDAGLNQREDGIAKIPGNPLSIEAIGEAQGVQKLLNFYNRFSDTAPAWSFNLGATNNGALVSGLDINSDEGKSRLFIDAASGNIGVGTVAPVGKVQILNKNENAGGGTLILGETTSSNLRFGYHENYSWIQSHGSRPLAINSIGNDVGIGTATPKAKLHAAGDLVLGTDANNQKFIFHSRTNGAGDFLQISPDNAQGQWNWAAGLTLRRSGKIGISVTDPQKHLHIENGELRVRCSHNNITPDIAQFYANNLTQGIGIGYNRIEALGSNADQHINLVPRGNGLLLIKDRAPFMFRRYLNLGDNIGVSTGVSAGEYTAAIVGFNAKGGDIDEGGGNMGAPIVQVFAYVQNGVWHIRADFRTHGGKNENWDIDVMFVINALVDRNY